MCGCGSNFDGGVTHHFDSVESIRQRKKDMSDKILNFMGTLPKKQPVIDVKKYGIDAEEYFAYNPKHGGNFSNFTDSRGFKHSNELNEYDY